MKRSNSTTLATAFALLLAPLSAALAQGAANATVHGHVQNAAGQIVAGKVEFTKDRSAAAKDQKYAPIVPIDASGNYTTSDVTPGDYYVYVINADGKLIDRLELSIKAGENKTLDFDMTREEYLKALTPEERKAIEDYKKKNAEVTSANKIVANLNATLKQVRDDLSAASKNKDDVSKDVDSMKSATAAKPDEGLLWVTYGDTLQAQGDHLAKADRDQHKSPNTDDAVLQQYSDAADAYKKGIDLDAAGKKPNPSTQAAGYNQMGNALAKAGKIPDAAAAFDSAAKVEPAKAGMYFGNEAAVMFNNSKMDDALAAANKAIAADPNRADPYFIKGQVLVQRATVDPKTQLPVAPPGCLEAYQKYLELAPDGPQAPTVKEVLTGFGQKIDTRYNAKKGTK